MVGGGKAARAPPLHDLLRIGPGREYQFARGIEQPALHDLPIRGGALVDLAHAQVLRGFAAAAKTSARRSRQSDQPSGMPLSVAAPAGVTALASECTVSLVLPLFSSKVTVCVPLNSRLPSRSATALSNNMRLGASISRKVLCH